MDTADGVPGWHLDKRIPVAFIFTIILQTGVGVWWAATLQTQVNANTQSIVANEVRWQNFIAAREVVVRNYEQFKATQEQISRELLRRLDEIRAEQLRVGENLLRREEELRGLKQRQSN